jgi:transcriptional regulator with GAF, ATPase, and Fis domain
VYAKDSRVAREGASPLIDTSSSRALPADLIAGFFALAASPHVDLPVVLDSVLDATLSLTGADAGGAIFVTDSEAEKLFWSFKVVQGTPRRSRRQLIEAWAGHSDGAHHPAKLSEGRDRALSAPTRCDDGFALFEGAQSRAWVPILAGDSKPGRLQVEGETASAFSPDQLAALEELGHCSGLLARRLLLREHAAARGYDIQMVGVSPALLEMERQLALVAGDPNSPVLLRGERGSGKESAAYAIHYFSARRHRPYLSVNSAAISADLAGDALFGHTRGAFTGADALRGGIFGQADSGTLFFDEISDMPLSVQASLLRALDTGEICPLGADRPHRVNVRIIAASNRDLDAMVAKGSFRADLYDRLNVFQVVVPPLRERGEEDLRLLADYFLRKACTENGRSRWCGVRNACQACVQWGGRVCTDSDFYRELSRYHFPGNVRELRNLMFNLAALVHDTLRPIHLRPYLVSSRRRGAAREEDLGLDSALRAHLTRVLDKTSGNKSKAARILGIPLSTLHNKLKRLNML